MKATRRRMARVVPALLLTLLLIALLALPSGAQRPVAPRDQLLQRLSQSVVARYWYAHPERAPLPLAERFRALRRAIASVRVAPAPAAPVAVIEPFNRDYLGLPQNEESVTVCRAMPNVVLGGTNDYRGLIDPEGNFTGWHLSLDGGASLANEGLLPPVTVFGASRPSGGDPVTVADGGCNLYASSLAYDPLDPFGQSNGIGVYKTTPAVLSACAGKSDPACWPTRRAVAEAQPPHFLDKEWVHVGRSGDAGLVVWAVYADFVIDEEAPLGFTSASIYAVRCDADLVACTAPILISGADLDVQFGDVTVGPDGRTYVTWSEIQGELEQTAQTFIHKLRIAPAGSTEFGPTQVIATETLAIPFGGLLHANSFRVATYPKHEVVLVNGRPRIFVVWDACLTRPLDVVCEEPQIKLVFSDDDGATWSAASVLSTQGDNYFPTIGADTSGRLAVAWFTNRHDDLFHNRQDVELVTVDQYTGAVLNRQRITPTSNEPESDPTLGSIFIGDYFEVFAHQGTAYVHTNANYRKRQFAAAGLPVPQQDNYLVRRPL